MKSYSASLFFADIPPNILMIPLAAMLIGVVIVLGGLYFQNRRRQMWHETARIALEKGQPLPPLVDDVVASPHPRTDRDEIRNDLRNGLVCIATGAGLFLFLGTMFGRGLGYVGAIPGFIGIALLLNAAISGLFRKSNRSTPPDQS